MKEQKTDFLEVYNINVNDLTEKKNGLTYLTWAHAWKLFKEIYPNASYKVQKFGDQGKPYFEDDKGIMVYTEVTANGDTYEMWLPVMDGANKSLKSEAYESTSRYGKRQVAAATMFDINKTIMRCLVKNLAMFGLGLYIYAGEDLPTVEEVHEEKKKLAKADFERAVDSITEGKYSAEMLVEKFNLTTSQLKTIKNLKPVK